jgi:hypothetical protein
LLAFTLPYAVVGLGLYGLSSAWAAMLGYQALMLAFLLRYPPADPGVSLTGEGGRALLPWLLAGLSLAVGLPLRFLWSWFVAGDELAATLAGWGLTPESWWLFALWLCLANPWLEQRYWRGVLGSPSSRPAATDAAFAGYHLLVVLPVLEPWWLPFVLAGLAAASWWWRQVIRLEGRFRLATWAHFLADLSVLVALGLVYGELGGG